MDTYYANSYSAAVSDALGDLYARLIGFLPSFLVAVIVLVAGWVLAVFIAKLVKQILQSVKLDEVGDKLGLDEVSARTGMKLSVSGAISWLIKWFLLLAIFLAAADILQLTQISIFLNSVLSYIPSVIAAAGIMLLGTMVAHFLARVVRHSVKAAGLASADLLGSITRWAVMVFTVLATLDQLGVAQAFVQTLFTGIIAMVAIAGGLAFGLGGKEHATKVLNMIERDIKS
jgi:hypothetical protein